MSMFPVTIFCLSVCSTVYRNTKAKSSLRCSKDKGLCFCLLVWWRWSSRSPTPSWNSYSSAHFNRSPPATSRHRCWSVQTVKPWTWTQPPGKWSRGPGLQRQPRPGDELRQTCHCWGCSCSLQGPPVHIWQWISGSPISVPCWWKYSSCSTASSEQQCCTFSDSGSARGGQTANERPNDPDKPGEYYCAVDA